MGGAFSGECLCGRADGLLCRIANILDVVRRPRADAAIQRRAVHVPKGLKGDFALSLQRAFLSFLWLLRPLNGDVREDRRRVVIIKGGFPAIGSFVQIIEGVEVVRPIII